MTVLVLLLAAAQDPNALANTMCPVRPTAKAKRSYVAYFNGRFIGFC